MGAAVVGSLLIGPVTGVACATAALYATTRTDGIGTLAREGNMKGYDMQHDMMR